jgi:hypothetical protein
MWYADTSYWTDYAVLVFDFKRHEEKGFTIESIKAVIRRRNGEIISEFYEYATTKLWKHYNKWMYENIKDLKDFITLFINPPEFEMKPGVNAGLYDEAMHNMAERCGVNQKDFEEKMSKYYEKMWKMDIAIKDNDPLKRLKEITNIWLATDHFDHKYEGNLEKEIHNF